GGVVPMPMSVHDVKWLQLMGLNRGGEPFSRAERRINDKRRPGIAVVHQIPKRFEGATRKRVDMHLLPAFLCMPLCPHCDKSHWPLCPRFRRMIRWVMRRAYLARFVQDR